VAQGRALACAQCAFKFGASWSLLAMPVRPRPASGSGTAVVLLQARPEAREMANQQAAARALCELEGAAGRGPPVPSTAEAPALTPGRGQLEVGPSLGGAGPAGGPGMCYYEPMKRRQLEAAAARIIAVAGGLAT
jgi:hypothetical protein